MFAIQEQTYRAIYKAIIDSTGLGAYVCCDTSQQFNAITPALQIVVAGQLSIRRALSRLQSRFTNEIVLLGSYSPS